MTAEAYQLPEVRAENLTVHEALSTARELGRAVYKSDSIGDIVDRSAVLYKAIGENEDTPRQLQEYLTHFQQGLYKSVAKKAGHVMDDGNILSAHYNTLAGDMVSVGDKKVAGRQLFGKGMLELIIEHVEQKRGKKFAETLKANLDDPKAVDNILTIADDELGVRALGFSFSDFAKRLRHGEFDSLTFKELYSRINRPMANVYSIEGLRVTTQSYVSTALQRRFPEGEEESIKAAEEIARRVKGHELAEDAKVYKRGIVDWLDVQHSSHVDDLSEGQRRSFQLKKKD